jgi:hypothetical protein
LNASECQRDVKKAAKSESYDQFSRKTVGIDGNFHISSYCVHNGTEKQHRVGELQVFGTQKIK